MEAITKEKTSVSQAKDKKAQTANTNNSAKSEFRFFVLCGEIGPCIEIIQSIAEKHPNATPRFIPKLIEEELMLRKCEHDELVVETEDGDIIAAKFLLKDSDSAQAEREEKG